MPPHGINIKLLSQLFRKPQKEQTEVNFWKQELEKYVGWYFYGQNLYNFKLPENVKVDRLSRNSKAKAAKAWSKWFQQRKYLADLRLKPSTFKNMVICDLGCGPHPSALCFSKCEIYGIDHLMDIYRKMGYPIDDYDQRYHFVQAEMEKMPFVDNYFDAAICVNAIDHVDNLDQASIEINRILKPGGKFCFHVHYHQETVAEPIVLDDERFRSCFSWVKNLKKVYWSTEKDFGLTKAGRGEKYVLWSNF